MTESSAATTPVTLAPGETQTYKIVNVVRQLVQAFTTAQGTLASLAATVAALPSTFVSSIAGNHGAFTLSGLLTNSTNVLEVVAAVKTDQQTATSAILAVTPLHQQDHDSAAKAWVVVTGSTGAIVVSYNVSGVVRNSTGNFTIAFSTAFASANFTVHATIDATTGSAVFPLIEGAKTTTTATVQCLNTSFSAADPAALHVVCHGRQ